MILKRKKKLINDRLRSGTQAVAVKADRMKQVIAPLKIEKRITIVKLFENLQQIYSSARELNKTSWLISAKNPE